MHTKSYRRYENYCYFKLFVADSDTMCFKIKSFKHKLTTKHPLFLDKKAILGFKMAILGFKMAILDTFQTFREFLNTPYVSGFFRYLLILNIKPLKFIYSPKTGIFAIFIFGQILVNKFQNSFPIQTSTLFGQYCIFPTDFKCMKY